MTDSLRFDAALAQFVRLLQERENARPGGLRPSTFRVERGPVNVRIVMDGLQSSVYCFVRERDGAILKAASWRSPFIAKGGPDCPATVRGNIYNDNPLDGTGVYGVVYLPTGRRK